MIIVIVITLLPLVEVQCQTAPYVSFMGQTLADHSYVDISQVGTSDSDSVQCHTDLSTCCSPSQGSHRGDWYFPNGERLPFPGGDGVVESRQAQRVDLRHTTGVIEPNGIYHCDIETTAGVNGNGMRESVYVGLYPSNGGKFSVQVFSYTSSRLC